MNAENIKLPTPQLLENIDLVESALKDTLSVASGLAGPEGEALRQSIRNVIAELEAMNDGEMERMNVEFEREMEEHHRPH